MFDLGLNLNLNDDVLQNIEEISSKEIAIIGVSARLPLADDVEKFWSNLTDGVDCIRELPFSRRGDIENYLKHINEPNNDIKYTCGAYLENIDKFDNEFFKISAKEASLMDPNQRIFLECTWKALEDAGYGGDKLVRSRTGVYVGFTARGEYQSFISQLEPESMVIAEAGNLSSIIPSRISYMLDFRGPSILVDTACSSSLVAVHLACQAIRNGECDQAIAGGVKISLLPVELREKLGIESGSGKVRTFDDDSDGTLFGEGCLAVLLKPLSKAVKDRDNIYAVIKGSAVNQDGASVGITAPNVLAQEDVIIKAWKDARIDPETITYIEAHGTGTKLGDPIEVNGIQRAFRQYTGRKQFCGIGSVKTNIGHLDNVSGIAGLLKAAMALKHRKLPPTLNFFSPNRKINFEESPVYVNARLADWEVEAGLRRCGVSSFGLSGTNCHVVLEEYSCSYTGEPEPNEGFHILTISAKKKEACEELVRAFKKTIECDRHLSLGDICYTASTGRGHYNYRVAILARDMDDLAQKLDSFCKKGMVSEQRNGIYFDEHRIAPDNKENLTGYEIRESDKKELSIKTNEIVKTLTCSDVGYRQHGLKQICEMYVKGASVDWELLFTCGRYRRVSLPSYPFDKKRCWIDIAAGRRKVNPIADETRNIPIYHPLLDRCVVESITQDIYVTYFNIDKHWVLNEHRIMGNCLIPGTVYLEMARECGKRYFPDSAIEFRDVIFIAPLVVADGETKEIQTIINKNEGFFEFTIAARIESDYETEGRWIRYCEGKVYQNDVEYSGAIDLQQIRQRCATRVNKASKGDMGGNQANFGFGPRWTSLMNDMYIGEDEVLAELRLPEEFVADLKEYYLHPSLLDIAVNAVTQTTGHGMYLPLSYSTFKIYGPTTERLFSYIRKHGNDTSNLETISFDVLLFDLYGKPIGEANGFSIKKVHEDSFKHNSTTKRNSGFYTINFVPAEPKESNQLLTNGHVLVFKEDNQVCNKLVQCLKDSGGTIIEVTIGASYQKNSQTQYTINGTEEDYKALFTDIREKNIKQIVHAFTAFCRKEAGTLDEMEEYQQKGVYSLIGITKSIAACGFTENIDMVIVSDRVYGVIDEQTDVNPYNAPIFGIGKVINREFSGVKCRCIDIDEFTDETIIAVEINSGFSTYNIAYRNGKRYVEELIEIELQGSESFNMNIVENGVYVITGGMGGLGIEIARCLVQTKKINIALIGRKKLSEDYKKKLAARITTIKEIEDLGSSVVYYSADVADMSAMSAILDELRAKFGRINGVIHAAGVAGDGYIISRPQDKFKEVMAPKVYGTWVLHKLTCDDEMDFFINFSSISSLYGGPGQGDYTAANSYLDSFSAFRNKKGKKTLTINWAAWKETGMAYDFGVSDDGIFKMLSTDTAVSAFKQVLGSGYERVIIGELNWELISSSGEGIPVKLSDKILSKLERKGNKAKVLKKSRIVADKYLNIRVKGRDGEDYSPTEMALARAWASVLDTQEIDIYESFNELGGDSILATQLLKEIDKVFQGMIDISSIFTYPTVNEMAIFIDGKAGTKKETSRSEATSTLHNNIDDILELLENSRISVDEADRILVKYLAM